MEPRPKIKETPTNSPVCVSPGVLIRRRAPMTPQIVKIPFPEEPAKPPPVKAIAPSTRNPSLDAARALATQLARVMQEAKLTGVILTRNATGKVTVSFETED